MSGSGSTNLFPEATMRAAPTLSLVLLIMLGLGCADPTGPGSPPTDAVSLAKAVDEGEFVFINPGADAFVDCLGEVLRFEATVGVRYEQRTYPNGLVVFVARAVSASGTATALTSGHVWVLDEIVDREVIRTTPAGESYRYTASEVWVSETGPTMHIRNRVHLKQDTDGNVLVERIDVLNCRLEH